MTVDAPLQTRRCTLNRIIRGCKPGCISHFPKRKRELFNSQEQDILQAKKLKIHLLVVKMGFGLRPCPTPHPEFCCGRLSSLNEWRREHGQ